MVVSFYFLAGCSKIVEDDLTEKSFLLEGTKWKWVGENDGDTLYLRFTMAMVILGSRYESEAVWALEDNLDEWNKYGLHFNYTLDYPKIVLVGKGDLSDVVLSGEFSDRLTLKIIDFDDYTMILHRIYPPEYI